MRSLFALSLILMLGASAALADTIDGRVVSINAESRDVTLDGGEVMHLTDAVAIDELAIGQLVRLDYEVGTVDVGSLMVLEQPPPIPSVEEPILEE